MLALIACISFSFWSVRWLFRILLGPKKLFIFKFVFERLVDQFEVADFCHQLTNNSHVCLVLFLVFSLVMFEKVIVRLEDWHYRDLEPAKRDA